MLKEKSFRTKNVVYRTATLRPVAERLAVELSLPVFTQVCRWGLASFQESSRVVTQQKMYKESNDVNIP